MIQLQAVYDRIAEALQERNTAPPEVRDLEVGNQRRRQELEELETRVTSLDTELKGVLKKEREYNVELEHFQKQKGMVTNEREFTAVISEIDYASKALEECVSRRGELEHSLDELKGEIADRREARPEEEEAHRKVVEAWEQRKVTLKDTVHELAQEAAELERQLNPKHRARFTRLLKSKGGCAVASVLDGSCSLCHFAIRPHLQQRVRRGQELIACEHCHRILYMEESGEGEGA
jgi:predicted  nucleic acid-binding Zn-ribbon protein